MRGQKKRTSPDGRFDDEPATGSYLLSRRALFVGLGVGGALIVGGYVGRGSLRLLAVGIAGDSTSPSAATDGEAKPNMWFEISKSGRITLYAPKAEMGQGIHTLIGQVAAEELEVRMDQLDVVHVTSQQSPIFVEANFINNRGFGSMTATASSGSTMDVYGPLRQSAATLREMLLLEGARQLGVARSAVQAKDGAVSVRADSSKTVSYGQIVASRKGELGSWQPLSAPVKLKSMNQFSLIGTSVARVDAPAKVSGTAMYGYDARLPEMLFGSVVHPPRYGASLVRAEPGSLEAAKRMPGVVKVVIEPSKSLVGVVAKTRFQAQAASAKLEIVWRGGSNANSDDFRKELTVDGGAVVHDTGDVSSKLGESSFRATYETPFAAHAHLEPISALVNVTSETVHVWVGSQQIDVVANDVLNALKKPRNVIVHPTYLGGGFGRRFMTHCASEAAMLSEAVGKPVHLGWTREQDMQYGPFRPATTTRLIGQLNGDGRILAIDQFSATGQVLMLPEIAHRILGFDPGALAGLVLPYAIDNYRVKAKTVLSSIPTGIWRGIGLLPNVFALESFIDELAHEAKIDPLKFRINNMPDSALGTNFKRVLTELGKRADWNAPLGQNEGRGIACSASTGTLVAVALRVLMRENQITVTQVHVCADPGLVVNPAGAKLQLVGSVMMGLSSALHESVTFRDGMAVETNFDNYAILRPESAPPVDVTLMGSGDIPAGLGEPGVGPISAALANAVFNATGKRLRSLPFTLT